VIGLIRYEEYKVPGTGDAMCWGATCYGETKDSVVWRVGDKLTLAAGDTAGKQPGTFGLITYHYPNGKLGNSLYKYEFSEAGGEGGRNPSTLFVRYIISDLTSVDTQIKDDNSFSFHPNPASDLITFNLNSSIATEKAEIMVVNLLGKVVESVNLNMGKSVDISSYDSGIYFVSLRLNNKLVSTKKLIVSN